MARRGQRLTAAITGKAREVGFAEAHTRTLLALGRKIAGKERKLREARALVKRLQRELRIDRREFRALSFRDGAITLEQLEVGGKADGADRAIALSEQPPRFVEVVVATCDSRFRDAEGSYPCELAPGHDGLHQFSPAGPGGAVVTWSTGEAERDDLADVLYPTRAE
jgi:hypothetical protein